MLLLGLGTGMALNPILLAAMSEVAPGDSGLASGVVNTAFMMGGALGLAALASIAAARTAGLETGGAEADFALNEGYRLAMLIGAAAGGLGALAAAVGVRPMAASAAASDGVTSASA